MTAVRRRDLAWVAALLTLLTFIWGARADLAVAGGIPAGDGVDVVYIAVATNFPDALGAGPAAGVANAPIILLPTNPPIPTFSVNELIRLDPKEVVIIGGTAVISATTESDLAALLPNATITRISGVDRYDTNSQLSASLFPVEQWLSIPAAAFTSNSPDVHDVTLGSSAYNNTTGFLLAPVYLPDNAEILQIKVSGYDTHVSLNLLVNLQRYSTTGTGQQVASISLVTSGGDFTETQAPSNHERVDNENYAYQFEVFNADDNTYGIGVYSIKIKYRLGTP